MTAVMHALPPSHPCLTVQRAFELKGVALERVEMDMSGHGPGMEEIYGAGNATVPGVTFDDGEKVHGSTAILAALDAREPEPSLYPEPIADAVREAEAWGDGELQDLGRRLPWAALQFRPEQLPTILGGEPLDGPGTDYALKYVRAAWKYHGISAERLANDLQGLPALLDHCDQLCRDGIMGAAHATAADLQIGATLRNFLAVGDLLPLMEGRRCAEVTRSLFGEPSKVIPAGAYPAGWVVTG